MRAMVLTCEPATAEQLHAWGSVHAVVEPEDLATKAREVAQTFTKKIPRVVRVAKECLNNIDPVDVNRSYRFEQGFTFELNLAGVADEARDAFVEKRDPKADKK
jgi:enoyl-CoA hydratase